MSTAVVTKRLISSDEYHKMGETGLLKPDERVELINGEIYTMTPIGSKHIAIVNQINELFVSAFIKQFIVSVQSSIHIDQWNEPEPDLAILRHMEDRYISALPRPDDILAVIEVSDTSYKFDKKVKRPLYASVGIPMYWIVDSIRNTIEVYTNPVAGQYKNQTLNIAGDKIVILEKTFEVSKLLILT